MEKYDSLLYCLNKGGIKSQREMAMALGISLGRINYLLREMETKGYLVHDKAGYRLTEFGQECLEFKMRSEIERKMQFSADRKGRVRIAVILAAGISTFEDPVGLLEIGGIPVIERLLNILKDCGIEKFSIVVGDKKEEYETCFAGRDVSLLTNEKYPWTGTMASLACVSKLIDEDFLLIEGNQIFEERAIWQLLKIPAINGMILTNPSNSKDEAYVELDEQGGIFRISKDIRQLNRIDAELLGISKISRELFRKMMEYYSENENPYLNYEYVIENIGRIYFIQGVLMDDLVWTVIENESLYTYAKNIIYPKIKKKEQEQMKKEELVREELHRSLDICDEDIKEIRICGGMTNQNFYVHIKNREYMLRLPGACTETMINREREYYNSIQAAEQGLAPEIFYFNKESGVKITAYIKGAQTLSGKSARLEQNIKLITDLLRKFHHSDIEMIGSFDVWEEYKVYKRLAEEGKGRWYPGFSDMEAFFFELKEHMQMLGADKKPCHNDLVAENFIKDFEGRLYLVDWEYAGYNDPMWDVASQLLECEFEDKEEELFLQHYCGGEPDRRQRHKIAVWKICQDILWSVWTIAKEAKGEDFGTYGWDRFQRAIKNREEYERTYER